MPAVVVGVVAGFGAAATIGVTVLGAVGIGIATAGIFHVAMKKLMPDMGRAVQSNQELGVGTPHPKMVVGEQVVSGAITKYEKIAHDEKEWHHMFVPLCSHVSESVELYQLDGKQTSALTGNGYRIDVRLGDQTSAHPRARQMMSSVDTNFVGYGYTDFYGEFAIDPEIFPNGFQDIKFKVKGIKVYDPRLDSTVGGSGSHRIDDPDTWEWTQNAALINFYWKRFHSEAAELPADMFSMDNIAHEANICDELVEYDDNGVTKTRARYQCNGVIDLTLSTEAVEDSLLKSCGGQWIELNGGFELQVAAYRGPAVMVITDDDIVGDFDESPHLEARERVNTMTCEISSAEHYYQAIDVPPVVSSFLKDGRDGGVELVGDWRLEFVTHIPQAQALTVIQIEERALGHAFSLPIGLKALQAKPGSVIHLKLKSGVDKLFKVISSTYEWATGAGTVEVKETAADIYNSGIETLGYDPAPNVNVDNTNISPVSNIQFTAKPEDAYRSGIIEWSHPSPSSVVEYLVTIYTGSDGDRVFDAKPDAESVNVPVLPPGNYTVYIRAKNIFTLLSETVQYSFNIAESETPADGDTDGDLLYFKPAPLNINLPYYFEFYFAESDLGQPPQNGYREHSGLALDVSTNVQPDQIYYVWYRVVIKGQRGTWNIRQVQAGGGLPKTSLSEEVINTLQRAAVGDVLDVAKVKARQLQIASFRNAIIAAQNRIQGVKNRVGAIHEIEQRNITDEEALKRIEDVEGLAVELEGAFALYMKTVDVLATANSARASAVEDMIAQLGDNASEALQLIDTFVDESSLLANRLEVLKGDFEDAEATIVSSEEISIRDAAASAAAVDEVATQLGSTTSQITLLVDSFVTTNSTLAQTVTQLSTKMDIPNGETVTGKITEQLDLNIGYCTVQFDSNGDRITSSGQCQAAGGSWVSGTLAQILDNIQIEDSAGNSVTLTQALQALTDENGNILASGSWLFDANDRVTGIRQTRNINGDTNDLTIIDLITDIFRITRASDGQAMFEADNTTGFLITRYHTVHLPDGTELSSEAVFRMPIIEFEYLDGNAFTQLADGTFDVDERRVVVRVYLGGQIIDTKLVLFEIDNTGTVTWTFPDPGLNNIYVSNASYPDDEDMITLTVGYSGTYQGVARTASPNAITILVRRYRSPITSAVRTNNLVDPTGWTALAQFTVPESPNWRTIRLEPFTVLLANSGTQTLSYNFKSVLNGSDVSTKSFSVVGTDPDYKLSTPLFLDIAPNYEWVLIVSVTGNGVVPAGTEIRVTQVPENTFTGQALN